MKVTVLGVHDAAGNLLEPTTDVPLLRSHAAEMRLEHKTHIGQAQSTSSGARQRRAAVAGGGSRASRGVDFANTLFGQNALSRQEMAAFQTEASADVGAVKDMLAAMTASNNVAAGAGAGRGRRALATPAGSTLFGEEAAKQGEIKLYRKGMHADWESVKTVVKQLAVDSGVDVGRSDQANDPSPLRCRQNVA